MARARTWTVEITIVEHEEERRDRVSAVVRRRPSESDRVEAGDDPTGRALAALAYRALDTRAGDIEQPVHRPMRMLS
jgi:hypothetical protein